MTQKISQKFADWMHKMGVEPVDVVEIEEPKKEKRFDQGCYIHPSCLSCPLPQCIYDKDS